jgi:hypothetical protein
MGELREVTWVEGEVVFPEWSPIRDLYIVMEGALRRAGYKNNAGNQMPPNVLVGPGRYRTPSHQYVPTTLGFNSFVKLRLTFGINGIR